MDAAPVSAGRLIVTPASSNNNWHMLSYVGETRETHMIISTDLEKTITLNDNFVPQWARGAPITTTIFSSTVNLMTWAIRKILQCTTSGSMPHTSVYGHKLYGLRTQHQSASWVYNTTPHSSTTTHRKLAFTVTVATPETSEHPPQSFLLRVFVLAELMQAHVHACG